LNLTDPHLAEVCLKADVTVESLGEQPVAVVTGFIEQGQTDAFVC